MIKKAFYEDDEISIGYIRIPKNATIYALEALGEILNFIVCWLKLFHRNYGVRSKIYNEAIESCSNKYQQ